MAQSAMMSLGKTLSLYIFQKPILEQIQSSDWEDGVSELEEHLTMFDATAESIIVDLQGKAQDNAKKISEFNRKRLVKSALSENFLSKYESVLKLQKDSVSLMKILKNFCKPETQEEKQEKAELNLEALTRMVGENEPFSSFVLRIEALADTVSANADVRLHLKNKAFKRNLNPDLIQFLRESGKLNKNTNEMASFLDSMMKHVRPASVHAIGTNEHLFGEIQQMNLQNITNTELLVKLTEEIEKLKNDQNKKASLNISAINEKIRYSSQRTSKRQTSLLPEQNGKEWLLNNHGQPVRCGQCGERGHQVDRCPGTCRVRCHFCRKVGHLQIACPEKRRSKN